jgi:hypothetical protein
MRAFLILILVALLPGVPLSGTVSRNPIQVKIGGVVWYTNYDEALAVARAQHKPIWVHFGENPG